MMRRIALGLVLMVAAAPWGAAAVAGTDRGAGRAVIEVFPGPDALKNALASANAGDTLNIHAGTYPEHVRVATKDLTLQSAGDGEVTVDGGCHAAVTVDVSADGVSIVGLRVIGAGQGFAPKEINFTSVATGRVIGSTVEDTCGNAEYGINVFLSQTIKVLRNSATGFGDAGIYIGAITSTPQGPLVIRDNQTFGNHRGIIIENSEGGRILVSRNDVYGNETTGIWITNSDGVRILENSVSNDVDTGIELDSLSDHNLIRGNTVSGHTYDLANDQGASGNCWIDNVYTTSLGDISC